MSTLRYCHEGGRVTGGEMPIPNDLCEYQPAKVEALVGCNRLKCGNCGAWVRHGPPGLVAKEDARPHLAEIYEAENWRGLTCLKKGPTSHRLYVCRCTAWAGQHDHMMADPDPDPYNDPVLPWRCDGHPTPEFPVVFDDGILSAETDLAVFVDRILRGWRPRQIYRRGLEGPALWLIWTYAYLFGSPEADSFSRACAARISDPDPVIVGRVLHLFTRFPDAEGVAEVVGVAKSHPERIAVGYAVPELGRYLTEIEMLAARLDRGGKPSDAMDLFRGALLTPLDNLSTDTKGELDVDANEMQSIEALRADLPFRMLEQLRETPAFAESDLEWLADHVVDIERAGPNRWSAVLSLLAWADWSRKEELSHLVVVAGIALVQSGAVDRGELREWLQTNGGQEAWVLPITMAINKRV